MPPSFGMKGGSLFWHTTDLCTAVLSHALTGERQELAGCWQLGFSGGIGLLVGPEGQPSWVSQHLALKVMATDTGLSVIQESGEQTPLPGFMATGNFLYKKRVTPI